MLALMMGSVCQAENITIRYNGATVSQKGQTFLCHSSTIRSTTTSTSSSVMSSSSLMSAFRGMKR